jgi:hypothetical protein
MPTAGLLFIALIALYIAASGKAKDILAALGAKPKDTGVPSTDGQGVPAGTDGTPTGLDLLNNNAATYNTNLNNPGSTNSSDNPLMNTNFGVNWSDLLGYYSTPRVNDGSSVGNGFLGPPIASSPANGLTVSNGVSL